MTGLRIRWNIPEKNVYILQDKEKGRRHSMREETEDTHATEGTVKGIIKDDQDRCWL